MGMVMYVALIATIVKCHSEWQMYTCILSGTATVHKEMALQRPTELSVIIFSSYLFVQVQNLKVGSAI